MRLAYVTNKQDAQNPQLADGGHFNFATSFVGTLSGRVFNDYNANRTFDAVERRSEARKTKSLAGHGPARLWCLVALQGFEPRTCGL